MLGNFEPANAQKAYAALVAAIEKTTAPGHSAHSPRAWRRCWARSNPPTHKKAYAASSPPSRKPPIPTHSALAEGLKAVPGKLEPADEQKVYVALVAAIGKTTHHYALRELAEGLKAVPGKVEPADVCKRRTRRPSSPPSGRPPIPTHSALGEDQRRCRARSNPPTEKGVRGGIVAAIGKNTAPNQLSELTEGLTAVLGKVEPTNAQKGDRGMHRRHREDHRSLRTQPLAVGLKAVPGKLEPANAQKVYAASWPPSGRPPIPTHSHGAGGGSEGGAGQSSNPPTRKRRTRRSSPPSRKTPVPTHSAHWRRA